MSTPLSFPIDVKSPSLLPAFERDFKGERAFSRHDKQTVFQLDGFRFHSSFTSLERESFQGSRVESRPLSAFDERLVAAIRRKEPLSESPSLSSFDTRLIRAITSKSAFISYPVNDSVVSTTLLDFCELFFSSFPELQHREVHSYLMGRMIDLTFCFPEIAPHSVFLKEFRYKVMETVQQYVDGKIRALCKGLAALEGGFGRKTVSELREEVRSIRARSQSVWKALSSLDKRPLLSPGDVAFVKHALLLEEELQQTELAHARALVGCQTTQEELPHVLALGAIYVEKARKKKDPQAAVQAAGLYNYALRLAGKKANRYKLFHKLHEVGTQLFELCGVPKASCPNVLTFHAEMARDRKGLKTCRKDTTALVKQLTSASSPSKVREVCRNISGIMKKFTCGLIQRCIDQLGAPPCAYAIIGFGSCAREEDTPQSDLEFGILLENEHYRPYFRNLSFLLHFQVVNLGETILPCLNIPSLREAGFYDRRTRRGFSFDGEGGGVDETGVASKGCKTPFGNRHTFQLIHTPEQMAAFQGTDEQGEYWVEKEPHLPMELVAHTLIHGEAVLIKEYQKALGRQLSRPYKKETMRSFLAKEHLYEEDQDHFDPRLGSVEKEGQLFQVKSDLYRLPHLLIGRLALFFGLYSMSTMDQVDELERRGIFQPEAAKNLRQLVATTTKIRLLTYQFYGRQVGTINAIAHQLGFTKQEGQFLLDQEAFRCLEMVYQVLLPFHKMVDQFFRRNQKTFETKTFWDETPFTLGRIASRLLQYKKAKEYYLQAKEKEPKNEVVLSVLGLMLHQLGESTEAISFLEQAYEIHTETSTTDSFHFAVVLNNLAMAYRGAGQVERAISIYEKAKEIINVRCGQESSFFATALNNLGRAYRQVGRFEESVLYLNWALEIDTAKYGKQHLAIARDLSNLALSYTELGQQQSALPLLQRALQMTKEMYGEQHPQYALHLNNLAMAYKEGGELRRTLPLFKKALQVTEAAYGEKHPTTAVACMNLALALQENGELSIAIFFFERVLEINKMVHGENDASVAKDLSNLAFTYEENEQPKRGLFLRKQALRVAKAAYGNEHPKAVAYLHELADAYLEDGELDLALSLFKREACLKKVGESGEAYSKVENDVTKLEEEAAKLRERGMRYLTEDMEPESALFPLQRAYEIVVAIYGRAHPTVEEYQECLMYAYEDTQE